MIYSYITWLGVAFQVYSRLPPKKANTGWIFYFKKDATGVVSHWISCLPARLPPSTKRTLSLASLPDSCSRATHSISVKENISHHIIHKPQLEISHIGCIFKIMFFFARQIGAVLFEGGVLRAAEEVATVWQCVPSPVTDSCQQRRLITGVSPSLPVTSFTRADQPFSCLLSICCPPYLSSFAGTPPRPLRRSKTPHPPL